MRARWALAGCAALAAAAGLWRPGPVSEPAPSPVAALPKEVLASVERAWEPPKDAWPRGFVQGVKPEPGFGARAKTSRREDSLARAKPSKSGDLAPSGNAPRAQVAEPSGASVAAAAKSAAPTVEDKAQGDMEQARRWELLARQAMARQNELQEQQARLSRELGAARLELARSRFAAQESGAREEALKARLAREAAADPKSPWGEGAAGWGEAGLESWRAPRGAQSAMWAKQLEASREEARLAKQAAARWEGQARSLDQLRRDLRLARQEAQKSREMAALAKTGLAPAPSAPQGEGGGWGMFGGGVGAGALGAALAAWTRRRAGGQKKAN